MTGKPAQRSTDSTGKPAFVIVFGRAVRPAAPRAGRIKPAAKAHTGGEGGVTMDPKTKREQEILLDMAQPAIRQSETDPQGSYTGVPENIQELPVQDADDL